MVHGHSPGEHQPVRCAASNVEVSRSFQEVGNPGESDITEGMRGEVSGANFAEKGHIL